MNCLKHHKKNCENSAKPPLNFDTFNLKLLIGQIGQKNIRWLIRHKCSQYSGPLSQLSAAMMS